MKANESAKFGANNTTVKYFPPPPGCIFDILIQAYFDRCFYVPIPLARDELLSDTLHQASIRSYV